MEYYLSAIRRIVLLLAIIVIGCSCLSSNPKPAKAPLRFNQNGKFKILNFADLHYGEDPYSDYGPIQDINSTRAMTDILSFEHPDLVVYTGDQITGDFMNPNGSAYIEMLLQPLIQGNYKWASVYGNHDIGPNVTREEILATEQQYELCYTLHGEEGLPGVTNYYLFIYPAENDEESDTPAVVLWFFDTRGGFNSNEEFPSNVDEAVVDWFYRENENILLTWGLLPALAFFHIPTLEYEPVQETISDFPQCTGLVDDIVVPQDRDTGFMQALLSTGTVKTAFVGHDHGNAWCCFYETIQLCYNRHTGYGGYGNWTRGARAIEISYTDLWGDYANYIRLENGTVIDHFPNY